MASGSCRHKGPKCKSGAFRPCAKASGSKLDSDIKLQYQKHGGSSSLSEHCAKMLKAALAFFPEEDSSEKSVQPIRFGPDRVTSGMCVLPRLLELESQIKEKATDARNVRDHTQAILKALLKWEEPLRHSPTSKGPLGKGVHSHGDATATDATPATSLNVSSKSSKGMGKGAHHEDKGKGKTAIVTAFGPVTANPLVVMFDSNDFKKWQNTKGKTVESVVEYFTSKGNEKVLRNPSFWGSFGFENDEVLEIVIRVVMGQYANPGPSLEKFALEMNKSLNLLADCYDVDDDDD